MPRFSGKLLDGRGVVIADGIVGDYREDEGPIRGYTGRMTIPATASGPVVQARGAVVLEIDGGPSFRISTPRSSLRSGSPTAEVEFVSNGAPIRTA